MFKVSDFIYGFYPTAKCPWMEVCYYAPETYRHNKLDMIFGPSSCDWIVPGTIQE